MAVFVAVPRWAVEEASAQHADHCQVCVTRPAPCDLALALTGSLEDGALPPVLIGDVVPSVLRGIIRKAQERDVS